MGGNLWGDILAALIAEPKGRNRPTVTSAFFCGPEKRGQGSALEAACFEIYYVHFFER
jgi:hypothetical protein